MKEPPNASLGSGHPMVWMIRSRGFFTSHSSFTPSAKICGFSEVTCCHSSHAWESGPRVPSASTVTWAVMSMAGIASGPVGSPLRSSPAGVVRTPITRWPSTSSESTGNPGKTLMPRSSALSPSQRTISQIEAMWLPWFFMVGGVGILTDAEPVMEISGEDSK